MSLKEWLKNALAGESAPLIVSKEENMLSGLNFSEALKAHEEWKVKLKKELSGSSERRLDVAFIAQDHNCVLGKWIHGTGEKQYSHLNEFKRARRAHANFHLAAAQVVIEHQSGNTEKAQELLKTTFRSSSNTNQLALVGLFTAADNKPL